MAWSPLAQGKNNLFTNEDLTAVGEKYGKTAAQVNLRFLIQSGVAVIPKSTHIERMEENFDLFDFTLTDDEMKKLEALDLGHSQFIDHYAPEVAEMFVLYCLRQWAADRRKCHGTFIETNRGECVRI